MLHHVTEKMQKIHLLSTRRSSLGDIRPLIPHILGEPNEEAKIYVTEKMQKIHLLSTRRSSLGDIRPLIPHILGEPNEEVKISTALVFFH